MKGLETGKDKIQKICNALRKETLEPAKQEAREIVENAQMQAKEIVSQAQKDAATHRAQVEKELSEKKRVFEASLQLACRQGIEALKQKMEQELFEPELKKMVAKQMEEPNVIAALIEAIVKALGEKGIDQELSAIIPKSVSSRSVATLLAENILQAIEHRVVSLGDFEGGVQIRLKGENMTLDFSDAVVREMIGRYIRRDFRELVFRE